MIVFKTSFLWQRRNGTYESGKYIVVTNNPLVWEKLHTTREMIYKETTLKACL